MPGLALERLSNDQAAARLDVAARGVAPGHGPAPGMDPAAQFATALGTQAWREFEVAREARRDVTDHMLSDLRMLRGEYDPEDAQMIATEGGSQIYLPLVANKAVLAEALLYTIYLDEGRPFAGKPSPVPEVPPEIQAAIEEQANMEAQQAVQAGMMVGTSMPLLWERVQALKADVLRRAKEWTQRQADYNAEVVDDELREGGFYEALVEAFRDGVALRGGFIKGPDVRLVNDIDWMPDGTAARVRKPRRCYTAPSPFDVFPSPNAVSCQDGTLSERIRMSRSDVFNLLGTPGFRDDVIRQVLTEFDAGSKLTNWYWEDSERTRLESMSNNGMFRLGSGTVDVIEHWTHATGAALIEAGAPPQTIDDPQRPYSCRVWMVGPARVIGVQVNDDPKQERPYWKFGFRKVRGSFWYEGVCAIGRPYQRMLNAAARAKSNNLGMAAGYVTELQADRLADGQAIRKPMPYDLIQTMQARNGASGPALFMHQAALHSQAYMQVMDYYSRLLDDALGLPSFLAGLNPNDGAGGTSSGLAQLRQMQTQAFGYFTLSIDTAIEGLCAFTHRDLILTPDPSFDPNNADPSSPRRLVGDVRFEARGARSLAERQGTQVRLNELLQLTANPIDLSIMGQQGRGELLREAVAGFDAVDVERVVPSRDALVTQSAMQAMQQQALQQAQPEKGAATDPAGTPQGAGQNMMV